MWDTSLPSNHTCILTRRPMASSFAPEQRPDGPSCASAYDNYAGDDGFLAQAGSLRLDFTTCPHPCLMLRRVWKFWITEHKLTLQLLKPQNYELEMSGTSNSAGRSGAVKPRPSTQETHQLLRPPRCWWDYGGTVDRLRHTFWDPASSRAIAATATSVIWDVLCHTRPNEQRRGRGCACTDPQGPKPPNKQQSDPTP